MEQIAIIGAGLAGCEAAWQLAKRGLPVTLFEMRPETMSPAHQTKEPAELVCSNSFKSIEINNAHGLLKQELLLADSLIIQAAYATRVFAGQALSVNRILFSKYIAEKLATLKSLRYVCKTIKNLEALKQEFQYIVIATGPLTSDHLAKSLQNLTDQTSLYFYDAIAPVVYTASIDMKKAFWASRYNRGTADYLNCPLEMSDYDNLMQGLLQAKTVATKNFEKEQYFEGCLPIEILASRGYETLSHGTMKPVGLLNPHTGKLATAVLQLRMENQERTLANLVGCQTKMLHSEQQKVFRMIPGLEQVEFARYGSMHRNTYLNAPRHLNTDLSLKKDTKVFLAGQITGVEGYTESTASGLWLALNLLQRVKKSHPITPSSETMIGGLMHYLQKASPDNFQPMNANFGLISTPVVNHLRNKKDKRMKIAENAIKIWEKSLNSLKN